MISRAVLESSSSRCCLFGGPMPRPVLGRKIPQSAKKQLSTSNVDLSELAGGTTMQQQQQQQLSWASCKFVAADQQYDRKQHGPVQSGPELSEQNRSFRQLGISYAPRKHFTVEDVAAADAANFQLHPSVVFWATCNTWFSSRLGRVDPAGTTRNFIACDFGSLFKSAGFICDTKYMASATKTLSFIKPMELRSSVAASQ